ncbi:MAG: PAS domain-containing protein [Hyphomicrobiales bacterium]|nr:PAS domain-containing protein [Hyphomicrobiales bacterium]
MKHSSTRGLFDYWNRQRGARPAPERVDIDPTGIRRELGDVFMLATDFADNLRFRLAGTRVCALFCREIKGETFASLWEAESRETIDDLIAAVTHERTGAIAGLTGTAADGDEIDLEMILLPLAHSGHARIRAIGALVPMVPPYWLGEKPLETLRLGALRLIGPDSGRVFGRRFPSPSQPQDIMREPREILPPAASRPRHPFVVYNGGRDPQPGEKAG